MIQLLRVAVVLMICQWAVSWVKRTPAVVAASAPATEFSGERALVHVRQIASKPHPTGSEAHAATRDYIVGEIRKVGLVPEIQSTTGIGTRYQVAGHVQNILVRVAGTQPGGLAVLLVAHYDGVAAGPAAGDDATGSAALLETLRALRAGPPLAHDVILLFTDSEESGLLGAAAFAREHRWAKDAGVVLNFEARGVNGPSLMFETGRGNLDVARTLRGVSFARGTSLSTAVYRRLPNDTDLSELMILDKPAMNFAFIGGVERYHTSEDDVAHLEPGSLQHHGAQALALARSFGNGPLPRPATADAVFFFFPALGTFVYPESFAIYFALIPVLLVVVALVRRRRTEKWTSSVIIGFTAALFALAVGLVGGHLLGAGFVGLHHSMASGDPRWSETYAVALALAVLASTIATHRIAVHNRNTVGVEAGAVLLWAVLSVVVAVMMPGASFLLTWPVVAAAVALQMSPAESSTSGPMNWLAAGAIVVIVVPTAYLMVVTALGLDAVGGAILGVLVAMMATLIRPVLVTSTDRWWPMAVPAAAALWFVIVGASSVRTSSEHPVGASLVLAIDADANRAFATGFSSGDVGMRWVAATIGGGRVNPSDMPTWMQRLAGSRPTAQAERFESPIPPPKVTVLKDSSSVGSRYVLVRVQPTTKGTLSIGLDLDTARVAAVTVDGRAVESGRYRRPSTRWRLDFVAPPDSGFTLGVTMDAADRPMLGVSARVANLVAWPVSLAARPADVFRIQNGDMSVIHTNIALQMPAKRRR